MLRFRQLMGWHNIGQQIMDTVKQKLIDADLLLKETFANVGERDEVQGVRNAGGDTYQRDRRDSE